MLKEHVILFIPEKSFSCFSRSLEALEDFKKILKTPGLATQCLSYDTTYELGNCYLSVLCYRQTEFVEAPVVPLMYMLHTQRNAAVHNYFFMVLIDAIVELTCATNVVIVTDEEIAIVNAIRRFLPAIPRFRCWLHALKNVKLKLRDLGLSKDQQTQHKSDFLSLLQQKSEDNFYRALSEKYLKWNKVIILNDSINKCINYDNLSRRTQITSTDISSLLWALSGLGT